MKVIFLPNNTASLMTAKIPMLQKLGVDAVGFNFAPKITLSSNSVIDLPVDFIGKVSFFFKFLYHLINADTVHWIYGSSSRYALIILNLVSLLKSNKFVEFCGTDIRSLEMLCQDVDFYNFDKFDLSLRQELGTTETSQRTQKTFSHKGFKAMPNSPELIEYLDVKYFKEFFNVSRSVNLSQLPFIGPGTENLPPLFVHVPSNSEVKGSKYFIEAAEKLHAEGIIRFKMITDVSHEEAIRILKESDVVVDQLVIGEFGVLSIEAMALGKPVICFLRPKIEKYYHEKSNDFPVVNASRENLIDIMRELALDSLKRKRLGISGRDFVEKFHDAEKNAALLISIYSGKQGPQKNTNV